MRLKVIILAGGKGTRIKSVLGKIPKILAPINKKTFLDYLIVWIKSWDICAEKDIILSTGVGHNAVKEHCDINRYQIKCIEEKKPLGTFGAIINVARSNFANHYLIINGDTVFDANLKKISNIYFSSRDHKTPLIILKRNSLDKKFNRYGGYKKIKEGWIFTSEKSESFSLGAFFISFENLKKRWLKTASQNIDELEIDSSIKEGFSIDKDCFGKDAINAINLEEDTLFIDIGIPSDLEKGRALIPKIIDNNKNDD
tara:strand:+ start:147 stop:914 length:768 start_codon:yes stop_codon:yes gene_type:complete